MAAAIYATYKQAKKEEVSLIERFGPDYAAYQRTVPMLLPNPVKMARKFLRDKTKIDDNQSHEPDDPAWPRPGHTPEEVKARFNQIVKRKPGQVTVRNGFRPVTEEDMPQSVRVVLAVARKRFDTARVNRVKALIRNRQLYYGEDDVFYGANDYDGTNADTAIYLISTNVSQETGDPSVAEILVHEVHGANHEKNVRAVRAFKLALNTIVQEKLHVTGTTFRPKDQKITRMVLDSIGPELKAGDRVLEIGVGSGILTKTLVESLAGEPNVRFTATDVNQDALNDAALNLSLFPNVDIRRGHLFEPVQGERFDIIFWNPPWYPQSRKGKVNGIARIDIDHQLIKEFIRLAPQHLEQGGAIYLVFPRQLSVCYGNTANQ